MFFIACYFETVNKQPSHLSAVQQWRQSPHDVEVLKESSIAITVTIIQWSTVHSCSNCLLNQAHSQLARQGRVWDYGSNVWQKAPAVGDCHSSHHHQFCQRRRALVYPVWKVMWNRVHVQRTPVAHSPPPAGSNSELLYVSVSSMTVSSLTAGTGHTLLPPCLAPPVCSIGCHVTMTIKVKMESQMKPQFSVGGFKCVVRIWSWEKVRGRALPT